MKSKRFRSLNWLQLMEVSIGNDFLKFIRILYESIKQIVTLTLDCNQAVFFIMNKTNTFRRYLLHKSWNNVNIIPGSDLITDTAGPLRVIPRGEWIAQPPANTLDKLVLPSTRVIIAHTATEDCTTQVSRTSHSFD